MASDATLRCPVCIHVFTNPAKSCPCCQHHAEIDRLRAERDALAARLADAEAENAALAAYQCADPYGDDYGNLRCLKVDAAEAEAKRLAGQLADARAAYAALRDSAQWLPKPDAWRVEKAEFEALRAALADEAPSPLAAALRVAREALAKVQRVTESDAFKGVFSMAFVHGYQYGGEQFGADVAAALAAIDAAAPPTGARR